MAIQPSGVIKLSEIQAEFGGSNPISMSEYYRGGSYVTDNNTSVPTSGVIAISQFYNTTAEFLFTISSNYSTPQDLRTLALAAGWDGLSKVVATIDSGIYISSNSTSTPALTVSGSFPTGLDLINNGYIIGMGGAGGAGRSTYGDGTAYGGSAGGNGGVALSISSAVSITNNGTIGGGGGGGGGGGSGYYYLDTVFSGGGGGGGGGRTGITNSSGGAGGTSGTGSGHGSAGGAGTSASAGGGGSGGGTPPYAGGVGGAGGTWGSSGSTGGIGSGSPNTGFAGGAGGAAVSGNSYVTWVATGTRYGALV